MWQMGPMGAQTVTAGVCVKLVEAATRSCQPIAPAPPSPVNSAADSLAALSTAFTFGSLLLGLIALVGAIAWGFVVKYWAEREAKAEAERCAKKWLDEEATPMLRREMMEWRKTFPQESPISAETVDEMVAAAGADGKEGDDGKK